MAIVRHSQLFAVIKPDPEKLDCEDSNWIHVWTDGGGNCGPVTMGVVIVNEGQVVMTHGEFLSNDATNNIAELTAILRGLQLGRHYNKPIKLYSDSSYALNSIAGIYNGPKNKELIETIQTFAQSLEHLVVFIKVKGHSLLPYNEYADSIASWFLNESKKHGKGTPRQPSKSRRKKIQKNEKKKSD